MKLSYTARTREEIELAFLWYERQRPGLGLEFLGCIEASLENIISFSESYRTIYACFRRCVIRRFPFSMSITEIVAYYQ